MTDVDDRVIEEVQKEGREFLYNMEDVNYKNTALKSITWGEIGKHLGVPPEICMKRWKIIRAKYVKLRRPPKSGSAASFKPKDALLLRSLDFLRDQVIIEPTESSFIPPNPEKESNMYQVLIDETCEGIREEDLSENAETEQTACEVFEVDVTANIQPETEKGTPTEGPASKKKKKQ